MSPLVAVFDLDVVPIVPIIVVFIGLMNKAS